MWRRVLAVALTVLGATVAAVYYAALAVALAVTPLRGGIAIFAVAYLVVGLAITVKLSR